MNILYQQNLTQLRQDFEKSINYTMIHLAYSLINLFEEPKKEDNSNMFYLSHIDLSLTPRKRNSESSFELCLVYSYNHGPKETIVLSGNESFEEAMPFHEKIPSIHYEKVAKLYNEFILPDTTGLNNIVANHIIGNIAIAISCSFKNYQEKIGQLIDEKWIAVMEKEQLENSVDKKIGKTHIKQKI